MLKVICAIIDFDENYLGKFVGTVPMNTDPICSNCRL